MFGGLHIFSWYGYARGFAVGRSVKCGLGGDDMGDGNDRYGGGHVLCFMFCGMSFLEMFRDDLFRTASFGLVLRTVFMQATAWCYLGCGMKRLFDGIYVPVTSLLYISLSQSRM